MVAQLQALDALQVRTLIFSYFKDKLRCKHKQIALGIEELCDRVARRSYELELIASQVQIGISR